MTEAQIAATKTKLEEMAKKEEEVAAVNELKNELEAVIYGSREKMEREDIVKVSTEEQREEVTKLCTEFEEWMYEAGATKADYESRLTKIRDALGPIQERSVELEARESLPENVESAVEVAKRTKAMILKNMTWVNVSKVDAAAKHIEEFEEWWTKKQEKQASLPLHEAPAYTKAEVAERMQKMTKELDKLKKIKKPKEAKKPKNTTKKDKDAAGVNAAKEEKLPETVEATETELANVRAKKAEAVEKEDFDAAHSLKSREKTLVDHLASLKADKDKSEL
jgi:hypoxia up-regulated 1